MEIPTGRPLVLDIGPICRSVRIITLERLKAPDRHDRPGDITPLKKRIIRFRPFMQRAKSVSICLKNDCMRCTIRGGTEGRINSDLRI